MDRITLKDYRCFHGEQTARLAPLTLLVGENSTGKTSFMAMLRALWEVAYGSVVPDFKEEPYDLGSFDEVVRNRGGGAGARVYNPRRHSGHGRPPRPAVARGHLRRTRAKAIGGSMRRAKDGAPTDASSTPAASTTTVYDTWLFFAFKSEVSDS